MVWVPVPLCGKLGLDTSAATLGGKRGLRLEGKRMEVVWYAYMSSSERFELKGELSFAMLMLGCSVY